MYNVDQWEISEMFQRNHVVLYFTKKVCALPIIDLRVCVAVLGSTWIPEKMAVTLSQCHI